MSAAAQSMALTAPLESSSLIEASAGTGKTWTLSGLFVRLIVEKGLPVEGVLAVTFTRAATAELRDRIRRKLRDTLEALDGGVVDDAFCEQLALRITSGAVEVDIAMAKQRLSAALHGFDDAAIYTIHGFCQRVLGDRAFSSAMPFDTEIVTSAQEAISEIVADFWRSRVASPDITKLDAAGIFAHEVFVSWLLGKAKPITPASLEDWLRPHLTRREFRIDRSDAGQSIAQLASCIEQRPVLLQLWLEHGADIIALLENHDGLHRGKYRKTSIPDWAAKFESYLRGRDDAHLLPEKFVKFTASELARAVNKGKQSPEHALFRKAEDYQQAIAKLTACCEEHQRQLKLDLLDYTRSELRIRMRERRVQTYDDLLLNLHEALQGAGGDDLATALRLRYPAALIDEFQDTDPLQFAIFERIYDGASEAALFLVGDPKQAIYSFRGADLFTYLKAGTRCHRHALTESQRSAPSLVQALNAVFGASSNPFRFQQIAYSEIHAAARDRAVLYDDSEEAGAADSPSDTAGAAERRKSGDSAPLRVFLCGSAADGRACTKGDATSWATKTAAAEIARLLNAAQRGAVRLGARPLVAGDIAVLVNSHRQGTMVRHALNELGIACADYANHSVFASDEAEQLERLLLAVQKPQRENAVRAALTSDLFGYSAAWIAHLKDNQQQWDARLNDFVRYHDAWNQDGFMRMFRRLINEQHVTARLAGFADGERRLTNLFHLAELLHGQSDRLHGMPAHIAWLAGKRRKADSDDSEDAQLRLESDENLVQIVTIHRSKGLEYAVTFAPFLWDAKKESHIDQAVFYHDPDDGYRAALDFVSERRAIALRCERDEELAEKIRLAYVALTRAKNRCYLFWGRIKQAECSPLAWLLHDIDGHDIDDRSISGDVPRALPGDRAIRNRIEAIAAQAKGAIRIVEPCAPARLAEPSQPDALVLAARELLQPVPQPWRLASFSSLRRAASNDEREEWRAETPDHDQAAAIGPAQGMQKPALVEAGGDRFTFPRGAAAGDCLHSILEQIDFSAPAADWRPVISTALRRAGYRETWVPELSAWLSIVLRTPLIIANGGAGLTLASLQRRAVLKELEFHLPLKGANPAQLSNLAAQHAIALPTLARTGLDGYLKGYVDLVFRHEGRFFVADYKSNWLGATEADYGSTQIDAAMTREGYHLQYLLYCTALHRWLRQRIADYDYERHVGGVFYLFLRGMHPSWRDASGAARGVFQPRPPQALIEAFDAALDGNMKAVAAVVAKAR
ncbi:MAG: exodeoxyribonuclease V subunit beta [Burkholderiales bacterium]|nr:exodeoxyribonuclease V subunit beta [Burkholderiales bacterium]